ncbi:hypothetical protein HNQ51_002374 [Inhella inkyongensis]|uniref:Uncharacterized protein n=1 Tax=Inhella inkyongensis TaxID=392593 RepID=A0A840S3W9_9BURK|nr:hypothetical protein [Inhella inkyongensis]MBB5205055.1 hypothetical protein [Inhella inkyongensis]
MQDFSPLWAALALVLGGGLGAGGALWWAKRQRADLVRRMNKAKKAYQTLHEQSAIERQQFAELKRELNEALRRAPARATAPAPLAEPAPPPKFFDSSMMGLRPASDDDNHGFAETQIQTHER